MRQASLVRAIMMGALAAGCGPLARPDPGQGDASSTSRDDATAPDADGTTQALPPSTSDTSEPSTGESTTSGSIDCDIAIVEATAALDAIVDGAITYFEAEHRSSDDPQHPLHHCPYQAGLFALGAAFTTPTLFLDCNPGPNGRCVPAVGGGAGAGYYDITSWTSNPVWVGLGFLLPVPHVGHYDFEYANTPTGYGECRFTAEGFADLDDDGVFSTFTRTGLLTERGAELSALSIDMPCE